jgi:hypothetical protein
VHQSCHIKAFRHNEYYPYGMCHTEYSKFFLFILESKLALYYFDLGLEVAEYFMRWLIKVNVVIASVLFIFSSKDVVKKNYFFGLYNFLFSLWNLLYSGRLRATLLGFTFYSTSLGFAKYEKR